jgi:hypothetical protein
LSRRFGQFNVLNPVQPALLELCLVSNQCMINLLVEAFVRFLSSSGLPVFQAASTETKS